jgi:hypothetical protein
MPEAVTQRPTGDDPASTTRSLVGILGLGSVREQYWGGHMRQDVARAGAMAEQDAGA